MICLEAKSSPFIADLMVLNVAGQLTSHVDNPDSGRAFARNLRLPATAKSNEVRGFAYRDNLCFREKLRDFEASRCALHFVCDGAGVLFVLSVNTRAVECQGVQTIESPTLLPALIVILVAIVIHPLPGY